MTLWRRLVAWVRSLFSGAAIAPEFSQADLDAIVAASYAAPRGGWYAWEAAQYRATRAPWFDPHRYDGSQFAYPPPNVEDHQVNYAANALECDNSLGADLTNRATYWIYLRTLADPSLRATHLATVDPIDWCVREYKRAGSPLVMPPSGWSGGSPERNGAWPKSMI